MSRSVFEEAMEIAERYGEGITFGGGEPTLHPLFWEFLGKALAATAGSDAGLWLATNGSQTKTALAIANLAKRGVLGVALSLDEWHDPIDDEVVAAFMEKQRRPWVYEDTHDQREVRDVSGKEMNAGRCDWGKDGCVCPGLKVEASGVIRACGCPDAPEYGTVFGPAIPDDVLTGDCWQEQKRMREEE